MTHYTSDPRDQSYLDLRRMTPNWATAHKERRDRESAIVSTSVNLDSKQEPVA